MNEPSLSEPTLESCTERVEAAKAALRESWDKLQGEPLLRLVVREVFATLEHQASLLDELAEAEEDQDGSLSLEATASIGGALREIIEYLAQLLLEVHAGAVRANTAMRPRFERAVAVIEEAHDLIDVLEGVDLEEDEEDEEEPEPEPEPEPVPEQGAPDA